MVAAGVKLWRRHHEDCLTTAAAQRPPNAPLTSPPAVGLRAVNSSVPSAAGVKLGRRHQALLKPQCCCGLDPCGLLLMMLLLLQRLICRQLAGLMCSLQFSRYCHQLLQAEELVVNLHKLELCLDLVTVVEATMQDLLGCLGCCGDNKLEVHKTLTQASSKQHKTAV